MGAMLLPTRVISGATTSWPIEGMHFGAIILGRTPRLHYRRFQPEFSPLSAKETTIVSARPHLWFGNNQAANAARFYAEHIPESSVDSVTTAPEGVPGAEQGTEFIAEFT